MRIRFALAILSAAALPVAGRSQQASHAKRAFTAADWYRLTTLNALALSPDGRWQALAGRRPARSRASVVQLMAGRPAARRYPLTA